MHSAFYHLVKSAKPSNFTIEPYSNTGGATAGGVAGLAAGGLAGLGQAAFDDEDDGLLSALRKALTGAAVGGTVGAGLGVGATLMRNRAVDKIVSKHPGGRVDTPEGREVVDATLRRHTLPLQPLWDDITGKKKITNQEYAKETDRTGIAEALMHLVAPAAGREAIAKTAALSPKVMSALGSLLRGTKGAIRAPGDLTASAVGLASDGFKGLETANAIRSAGLTGKAENVGNLIGHLGLLGGGVAALGRSNYNELEREGRLPAGGSDGVSVARLPPTGFRGGDPTGEYPGMLR